MILRNVEFVPVAVGFGAFSAADKRDPDVAGLFHVARLNGPAVGRHTVQLFNVQQAQGLISWEGPASTRARSDERHLSYGIVSLGVLRHCAGRASRFCRCVVSLNISASGLGLGCIV